MFIFDPGRYQFNAVALPAQPLRPEEFAFLTDSDDLFAVSLATLGKDVGWHVNAHKADPVEIGLKNQVPAGQKPALVVTASTALR